MVYIILVNWNAGSLTVACLESLTWSTFRNIRIIIVDNGSQDDSHRQVQAWANSHSALDKINFSANQQQINQLSVCFVEYTRATAERGGDSATEQALDDIVKCSDRSIPLVWIEAGENLGYGRANNVGLRYALHDPRFTYAWILNNDTIVRPNTLAEMVKFAKPPVGLVGCVVRYFNNPTQVQAYGGGYFSQLTGRTRLTTTEPTRPLDFLLGANMLIDRTVLELVGLWDEDIFMYYEENEFCIRILRHGFTIAVADNAEILHKAGASTGTEGSYFAWSHVYKNKVYTLMKHYGRGPWMLYSLCAWTLNAINPRISPEKRRAARDGLHALRNAMLRGK